MITTTSEAVVSYNSKYRNICEHDSSLQNISFKLMWELSLHGEPAANRKRAKELQFVCLLYSSPFRLHC